MCKKLTMVLIALCMLVGMTGTFAFAAQEEGNLIVNGGFENMDGFKPVGWTENYGARDFQSGMVKVVTKEENPSGVRNGNRALMIGGEGKVIVGDEPVYQKITTGFTPGEVYTVSGWMKTEALVGRSPDIKFDFFFAWFNASNTRIDYSQTIEAVPGVGDWKEFSGITRVPADAAYAMMYMRYSGVKAEDREVTLCGTYYWDDISLVPAQEPDNLLKNAGFEAIDADGKTPTGWKDRYEGNFSTGIVKAVDKTTTPEGVRSGNRAMMLGGTYTAGKAEPIEQRITEFSVGELYTVSAWVKVGTPAKTTADATIAVYLFMDWLNASGSRITCAEAIDSTPSITGVWKELSVISQVPEGAVTGVVQIRYAGSPAADAYGTYYFDDFSLSKVTNILENGSFEQGKMNGSNFQPSNWVNRHVRDFSSLAVMTSAPENVYDGVYALSLGNNENLPWSMAVAKTNLNYVEEGALYRFSAWVKVGAEADASISKSIYLSWNTSYQKPVNGSSYDDTESGNIWLADNSDRIGTMLYLPKTTAGWEEVSCYLIAPKGAKAAIMSFQISGTGEALAGNTFIDSMRFEKVDSYMQGGDFEDGAKEWRNSEGAALEAGILETENENSYIHMTGADETIKVTIPNDYMMRGKALELSFDYRLATTFGDAKAAVKFASGLETSGKLISGDGNWHKGSLVFSVPTDNKKEFEISFGTVGEMLTGDAVDFDNVTLTFFDEAGEAKVFSKCIDVDTNTLSADIRGEEMVNFTAGEEGVFWYYPAAGEEQVMSIANIYKMDGSVRQSVMVSVGNLTKTAGGRGFCAEFTVPENLDPASNYMLKTFLWNTNLSPIADHVIIHQVN